MPRQNGPLAGTQLTQKPPYPPNAPLSEYVQQALAVLLGFTNGETVVLKASPAGVLYTSSPRLSDVIHYVSTGAGSVKQGDNIQATELLLRAHPDNADKIWVRTRATATANNAYPLAKGDVINFSVENLDELHIMFAGAADTLIVGYSL